MATEEVKTFIQIGDETVDAATVKVPDSRVFRGAWQLEGDVITVDMDAAREIARDEIRRARTPKLQALDVDYQRSHETGAATTDIVQAKQRLRDYPADSRLDAAQNDTALAAALDQILTEIGAM